MEDEKSARLSHQLAQIESAKTAPQIAKVVNHELPVGLHAEAFLRGLSKLEELHEPTRILDQAWGKKGR